MLFSRGKIERRVPGWHGWMLQQYAIGHQKHLQDQVLIHCCHLPSQLLVSNVYSSPRKINKVRITKL